MHIHYKQGFIFYVYILDHFLFVSISHFINLLCLILFSNHSIFSLKLGSYINVEKRGNR